MASTVVVSQLAPTGVLRAGINLSNFLLVTGRTPDGDPAGVSPDMAAALEKDDALAQNFFRNLNQPAIYRSVARLKRVTPALLSSSMTEITIW